MKYLVLLLGAILMGCAPSATSLSVLDPATVSPATTAELNRALYGQTVDLVWDEGDVATGARAVVVGADSVRYVPRRARAVQAQPVGALVRIRTRSATREGAGTYLGGIAGALLANRILGGTEMSSTTKGVVTLSAFVAGVFLGRRAEGARPARDVVLYERGQVDVEGERSTLTPPPR